MICHEFHHWWVIRREDSLITHGPTDVGRSRKFFRNSWATRCRFRNPLINAWVNALPVTEQQWWETMWCQFLRNFWNMEENVSTGAISETRKNQSPVTFPMHGKWYVQSDFRGMEGYISRGISKTWKTVSLVPFPKLRKFSLLWYCQSTESNLTGNISEYGWICLQCYFQTWNNHSPVQFLNHGKIISETVSTAWKIIYPVQLPEYGRICLRPHCWKLEEHVSSAISETQKDHSPVIFPKHQKSFDRWDFWEWMDISSAISKHGKITLRCNFWITERSTSGTVSKARKIIYPVQLPKDGRTCLRLNFRNSEENVSSAISETRKDQYPVQFTKHGRLYVQ